MVSDHVRIAGLDFTLRLLVFWDYASRSESQKQDGSDLKISMPTTRPDAVVSSVFFSRGKYTVTFDMASLKGKT